MRMPTSSEGRTFREGRGCAPDWSHGGPGVATPGYRRVTETTGYASPKDFHYNTGGQLIEEDTGATVNATYLWGGGYIDALICRGNSADGNYYALYDANFNVTGLEMNGTMQERFAYSAYGTRGVLNASWNGTTDTKNWVVGWQGLRWDAAIGMYYARNRWFSPTLMRWGSWDPMGYPDGLNTYLTDAANPINRVDPSGLVTLDEGNDAHRIISARYKAFHPAAFLDRELWEIAMAVNPGVSPLKLTKPIHYVLDLRPDIYDPPTNALYEIKPLGSEPLAFTKASMYVGLLHLAQVGAKFGPRNDPAVWGLAPFWGNSRSASAGRWLMWFSIFPGTISYEILNCKPRNAPKLVYVPVPVPAPASRWARTPPPVPNGGILDLIPNWGIENYNTAGMVFAAIGLAATGGVIVEAAPAVIPALVPALKQALKQALAPAGAGRWLTDG